MNGVPVSWGSHRLKRLLITLLVAIPVLVGCLYGLHAWSVRRMDPPRPMPCVARLCEFGSALHSYAYENAGAFPKNIEALKATALAPKAPFRCPSTRLPPERAAYLYISGQRSSDDPTHVLAYEPPGVHSPDGGCVLFIDGHVEWAPVATLRERVDSTMAAVAAGNGGTGSDVRALRNGASESVPEGLGDGVTTRPD